MLLFNPWVHILEVYQINLFQFRASDPGLNPLSKEKRQELDLKASFSLFPIYLKLLEQFFFFWKNNRLTQMSLFLFCLCTKTCCCCYCCCCCCCCCCCLHDVFLLHRLGIISNTRVASKVSNMIVPGQEFSGDDSFRHF